MIHYQELRLIAVFSSNLDPSQFLDLFDLCFPVLKTEWEELDVAVDLSVKELSKSNCQELLYQLCETSDFTALNAKLLICLFWKLVESFIKLEPAHVSSVVHEHAENRPIIFSSFHPDAARLGICK